MRPVMFTPPFFRMAYTAGDAVPSFGGLAQLPLISGVMTLQQRASMFPIVPCYDYTFTVDHVQLMHRLV